MDLKSLTAEERNALIDALVVAMYSDAHLAQAEDARIERILNGMGYAEKFERDRELDAAVTRVRKYADAQTGAREVTANLAQTLSKRGDRDAVIKALTELVGSDNRVAAEETRFLEMVKAAFMADRIGRNVSGSP
jgi:uncharacterized tellurite resistance protein B-like protein